VCSNSEWGTGTSFPAYPRHCEVTGIDLAADMLGRARAKIAKNTWFHLQVMEMDALNLTFEDNSFDYVAAFHTVTVVPDPIRMLAEANRVCRPGRQNRDHQPLYYRFTNYWASDRGVGSRYPPARLAYQTEISALP
jgi:ubiquinone/menaquinone biosynthesis C-methylase UbiE